MSKEAATTDVLIIGAGPIGIEMAVALKSRGIDYLQVEAGQIASTIDWWAPGTSFFSSPERISICGVPLETINQGKATREEYLSYLRAVCRLHNLNIRTYERVTEIRRADGRFAVTTEASTHGVGGPRELARSSGNERPQRKITTNKIVLAIGDMQVPRMLDVPGEHLSHVSHFFEEPHRYFGKKVLIVGGKNSAAEAAIRLYRLGCRVTLCYRRAELDPSRIKYWLYPELKGHVEAGRIAFFGGYEVQEIGTDFAILKSPQGKQQIGADFVLLLTGYEKKSELFEQLGMELYTSEKFPIGNVDTMETSVPGVFVAGTAAGAAARVSSATVFIENSHEHVDRIVARMTGRETAKDYQDYSILPEN